MKDCKHFWSGNPGERECLWCHEREVAPAPGSTFSEDIPPEIRALMDSDRADAEASLWWMIEHPTRNGAYWTGCGWADISGPAMQFTTRGHAEWEMSHRSALHGSAARITQHGPAIDESNELTTIQRKSESERKG